MPGSKPNKEAMSVLTNMNAQQYISLQISSQIPTCLVFVLQYMNVRYFISKMNEKPTIKNGYSSINFAQK